VGREVTGVERRVEIEDDPVGARDYVVCRVEELPTGSRKLVPVGKFGVGVFNVGGEYHAITNYCPHAGGPLCLGRVGGMTLPRDDLPEKMEWVREGEILKCPWHLWEFDIATGTTIAQPAKRIRTYEVRVEEGMVILRR